MLLNVVAVCGLIVLYAEFARLKFDTAYETAKLYPWPSTLRKLVSSSYSLTILTVCLGTLFGLGYSTIVIFYDKIYLTAP